MTLLSDKGQSAPARAILSQMNLNLMVRKNQQRLLSIGEKTYIKDVRLKIHDRSLN